MLKVLEDFLWNEISYVHDEKWDTQFHRSPYDVINEMLERKWIKSPKQAHATLNKWIKKGLYEYGSRFDLGWKCKKNNDDS